MVVKQLTLCTIIVPIELSNSFLIGRKRTVNFRNNNHVKDDDYWVKKSISVNKAIVFFGCAKIMQKD